MIEIKRVIYWILSERTTRAWYTWGLLGVWEKLKRSAIALILRQFRQLFFTIMMRKSLYIHSITRYMQYLFLNADFFFSFLIYILRYTTWTLLKWVTSFIHCFTNVGTIKVSRKLNRRQALYFFPLHTINDF